MELERKQTQASGWPLPVVLCGQSCICPARKCDHTEGARATARKAHGALVLGVILGVYPVGIENTYG